MRKIVGETVKYRQDNNIIRQDMIHLVMEAIKGNLKHSDSDMKYDDAGFATVSESEYGRSLSSKMGLLIYVFNIHSKKKRNIIFCV